MGSHLKKSIKLVISLALAKKSPFHLFIKKPRKSRFSKNKILSRKTKPSKNKPSGKVPQKIHSLFIFNQSERVVVHAFVIVACANLFILT